MIRPMSSSAPLSDREIEELDEALAALRDERDPLDVVMLDGFLVGVLLQPDPVPPSEWLPLVFDASEGEPLVPGGGKDVERVIELVMRRYNTLASHIAAREPFDLIVVDVDDDEALPGASRHPFLTLWSWAAGFMEALDAFPALIDRFGDDDDVDVALLNITRHLHPDPDDDSDAARQMELDRDEIDRELPLDDLDDAIEQLVLGVLEIADVTRPRRPVERAMPKIGRNDPCPCGSGRKYKQCHGRDVS